MPLNFTTSRPAANPQKTSDLALAAVVAELPNNGGFTVDLVATGLTAPPTTIQADTVKDSDTIVGEYPTAKVGDGISGTGIPASTTVAEVNADSLKLSKVATADGTGTSLTLTPKAGVKLCSLPIAINQSTDATLGTILELAIKLASSGGEKIVGQAQLVLDTELSFNRIPRA